MDADFLKISSSYTYKILVFCLLKIYHYSTMLHYMNVQKTFILDLLQIHVEERKCSKCPFEEFPVQQICLHTSYSNLLNLI